MVGSNRACLPPPNKRLERTAEKRGRSAAGRWAALSPSMRLTALSY
jgi:hypothetical protein